MKEKVGFIGLGLIGGSLAKAIRTYFPDYEIVAFDSKIDKCKKFSNIDFNIGSCI